MTCNEAQQNLKHKMLHSHECVTEILVALGFWRRGGRCFGFISVIDCLANDMHFLPAVVILGHICFPADAPPLNVCRSSSRHADRSIVHTCSRVSFSSSLSYLARSFCRLPRLFPSVAADHTSTPCKLPSLPALPDAELDKAPNHHFNVFS